MVEYKNYNLLVPWHLFVASKQPCLFSLWQMQTACMMRQPTFSTDSWLFSTPYSSQCHQQPNSNDQISDNFMSQLYEIVKRSTKWKYLCTYSKWAYIYGMYVPTFVPGIFWALTNYVSTLCHWLTSSKLVKFLKSLNACLFN